MKKENWQQIGKSLEELVEAGHYPAVGYDEPGWEAWIFIDRPQQGQLGRHLKVFAETATEAMSKLILEVEEAMR